MTRRRFPFSPETGAAAVLFAACFVAVHHFFWARGQIVDWPTYRDDGHAILDRGLVPYRDFPVEYPPGALPVFVVPALFSDYARVFADLMFLCGIAVAAVCSHLGRVAGLYAALAPVLVGSLILSRFDLWPVLFVVLALLALVEERHATGWALLGAGVAAKLWPLVLVPLALVWSVRAGRRRAPLAGLVVVAAVFLPFAIVAPHGLWASLHGQASRPLQVESLGASLLAVVAHPQVITSHGSQNIAGHGLLAALFAGLQLLALVVCFVEFARGPATRDRFLTYAAAAVCAFVAFGKVLSPQYLLWLIPLVPLVARSRRLAALALLTAACVLTQVWFPLRYFDYAGPFHLAGVVLARNLVLCLLFAVLVWPLARRPDRPRS